MNGWVKYTKTKLELLVLGNLMGNKHNGINGEISKGKYRSKEVFLETSN